MEKYQINAGVTKGLAEEFESDQPFDLILCDVPCSNSGVLHKRPEARWRLTPDHLEELQKRQFSILEQAKRLLGPQGQIWYMTCSILKSENEEQTAQSGMKKLFELTQLPDSRGFDGGYGCILRG